MIKSGEYVVEVDDKVVFFDTIEAAEKVYELAEKHIDDNMCIFLNARLSKNSQYIQDRINSKRLTVVNADYVAKRVEREKIARAIKAYELVPTCKYFQPSKQDFADTFMVDTEIVCCYPKTFIFAKN